MNGSPEPAGYWSEIRAEGLVYGTGEIAQYVLGTFQTISPVLALRWLRGEALRVADRLDPDPNRSTWVRPAMRQAAVPAPDCPTELRGWADDPAEQRAARTRVKDGDPLFVVVPDVDCTYTLSVWPIRLPSPCTCSPRTRGGRDVSRTTAQKAAARENAREDKDRIITRYRDGASMSRLASEYGVTSGWLALRFDEWKEPRRDFRTAHLVRRRDRSAAAVVRGPGVRPL